VLPVLVHAGDTVIDVGAHSGVYTWRLARLVGRNGHVLAYEPQPALASYLRAASRRGPMRRVDLRSRALSDQAGEAMLSIPIEDGNRIVGQATLRDIGEAVELHRVPVAVLDDEVMPGRVAFMKVDVEGHELALLRGARRLLAEDRPTLLVEVEARHAGGRVEELGALLLDELGYSSHTWDGHRLRPVPRERWTDDLNHEPDGGYVRNFVFTP
jgi:FkbM family methyltransferase